MGEWEVKLSEIDALLTEQFEHGAWRGQGGAAPLRNFSVNHLKLRVNFNI